jgi:endonuclease/exonuclease/phosphatase family metal-dependent hydrolase
MGHDLPDNSLPLRGSVQVVVTVRVLTYNVRGLRDDFGALTRVVRAAEPDVVAIQEAPIYLRWRSKCARLARVCGLVYVAGGRTAGGNLIMVAPRVRARGPAEQRIRQPLRDPIRGVVSAELEVGGARLGVVGCHLGLKPDGRRDQVQTVIGVARGIQAPTVVAGDLNELPTGPCWQALGQAGFTDPAEDGGEFTFPATAPRVRIDAILTGQGVTVKEYGVPHHDRRDLQAATDHLPVLAVLDIPKE